MRYASGQHAKGECQKCGLEFPYIDLVDDEYYAHLRVCVSCKDLKHPQEKLVATEDAVQLWRPAPESRHAPTAVTLAVADAGAVNRRLTWSESTSQDCLVAGYRVYASSNAGESYVLLATVLVERAFDTEVEGNPLEYLASTLAASTAYLFYVIAYDTRGLTSSASNVVSTTTGTPL